MFISGYQSDDIGAREDELFNPTLSQEIRDVYEAGFGQKHRRDGIVMRLPSTNPAVRGVGQRFPTQSSGMRQLAQGLKLSTTP